nr:ABC transporter ATP-binding protein [Treponema sp.]
MSTIKKLTSGMPKKVVLFTLITPFAMTGEVIMEVMIPLYMANIIDIGIVNHDLPYVLKTGITMILFSCFSFISGMVGARLTAIASQGFAKNLRARLFHSVQNFSFSNIDHFSSGSLVTRLTTDVTNVMNLYQQIIRTFIRSPMMIFSGVFLACSINLRLAVYLIALIPVLGFILIAIALTAYPRFKLMLRHYDKLNTLVQENLTGIRLVKSFVRQDFENKNFEKLAADFRNAQLRAEKIVILNMPVMRICVYMCVSAVMWSGGIMAIYGGIQ